MLSPWSIPAPCGRDPPPAQGRPCPGALPHARRTRHLRAALQNTAAAYGGFALPRRRHGAPRQDALQGRAPSPLRHVRDPSRPRRGHEGRGRARRHPEPGGALPHVRLARRRPPGPPRRGRCPMSASDARPIPAAGQKPTYPDEGDERYAIGEAWHVMMDARRERDIAAGPLTGLLFASVPSVSYEQRGRGAARVRRAACHPRDRRGLGPRPRREHDVRVRVIRGPRAHGAPDRRRHRAGAG